MSHTERREPGLTVALNVLTASARERQVLDSRVRSCWLTVCGVYRFFLFLTFFKNLPCTCCAHVWIERIETSPLSSPLCVTMRARACVCEGESTDVAASKTISYRLILTGLLLSVWPSLTKLGHTCVYVCVWTFWFTPWCCGLLRIISSHHASSRQGDGDDNKPGDGDDDKPGDGDDVQHALTWIWRVRRSEWSCSCQNVWQSHGLVSSPCLLIYFTQRAFNRIHKPRKYQFPT